MEAATDGTHPSQDHLDKEGSSSSEDEKVRRLSPLPLFHHNLSLLFHVYTVELVLQDTYFIIALCWESFSY